MNESQTPQTTTAEKSGYTPRPRTPPVHVIFIAIGSLCLGLILGHSKNQSVTIDVSGLAKQIAGMKSSVDNLKRSLE